MQGMGKVIKQLGARGFYATVQVMCEKNAQPSSSVTLDPSADDPWYRSQGWTDASLAGAALGLKVANRTAACSITRIDGMPCDTNSTLVAIAAMRAVWAAFGFTPDKVTSERLEGIILRRSEVSVANLERELGLTND